MVSTERDQNWIIYSLLSRPPEELELNLKCLQDCVQTDGVFQGDLRKLAKLQKECCEPSRFSKRFGKKGRMNAKA